MRARRARGRAAPVYDAHAALHDEVQTRLLEQLDYLKVSPARVLDFGCASGRASAALQARFPAAHVVGIDPALAFLHRGAKAASRLCGDLERLPLVGRSFDLAVSNLGAYWCAIDRLLPELLRVMAPGGLLLFCTFGPDTLRELRDAFQIMDQRAHVLPFVDMHDIGDALGRAGFAEPIVQMDRLTLTYASLAQMFAELAALGMRGLVPNPVRGLYGKSKWAAMNARYPAGNQGLVPASFEVIYASAWKPLQAQRSQDGKGVIHFYPKRTG